jgi:hypothetical protein
MNDPPASPEGEADGGQARGRGDAARQIPNEILPMTLSALRFALCGDEERTSAEEDKTSGSNRQQTGS